MARYFILRLYFHSPLAHCLWGGGGGQIVEDGYLQLGYTNLAKFILYSISGSGKLPWFNVLFVIAIHFV